MSDTFKVLKEKPMNPEFDLEKVSFKNEEKSMFEDKDSHY